MINNFRRRPVRDVKRLYREVSFVRKELLAVNYRRFKLTFGDSLTNPFEKYEEFVSDSKCQNYALALFSDFVSVTADDPFLINPADMYWRYFFRFNDEGAIKYVLNKC